MIDKFNFFKANWENDDGGAGAAGAAGDQGAGAGGENKNAGADVGKGGEGGAAAAAAAAAGDGKGAGGDADKGGAAGAAAGEGKDGKGAAGQAGEAGAGDKGDAGKGGEAKLGPDGKPIVGEGDSDKQGKDGKDDKVKPDWASEKAELLALYAADLQPKIKAVLDKYSTKADAVRALAAADVKISEQGELIKGMVKVPGKDAKPEEVAAFRKAIGVPESPDKYEIERPKDFQPTELDTAFEKMTREIAHANNITPDQLKALVKLDQQRAEMVQQHLDEAAKQAKRASEDELRLHFGVKRFDPMIEMVERFWEKQILPHFGDDKDSAASLMRTQLADGRVLGAHPGFIKALAQLAMQFEDSGAFVDGEPMSGEAISSKITELKKLVGTDAYTNEVATKLSNLLAQQERLKGKAA